MTICYCGNHLPFQDCCQPYIDGLAKAANAEALMRSRYSAYVIGNADYLIAKHDSINAVKYYKKALAIKNDVATQSKLIALTHPQKFVLPA